MTIDRRPMQCQDGTWSWSSYCNPLDGESFPSYHDPDVDHDAITFFELRHMAQATGGVVRPGFYAGRSIHFATEAEARCALFGPALAPA